MRRAIIACLLLAMLAAPAGGCSSTETIGSDDRAGCASESNPAARRACRDGVSEDNRWHPPED
jgi:hypothetical protein